MKPIIFSYKETSLVAQKHIDEYITRLAPEQQRIVAARSENYTTDYASINAPFDDGSVEQIKQCIAAKKELNPALLVVIGIGGSSMGTRALAQACRASGNNPALLVIETVDADELYDHLTEIEQTLADGKKIIVTVITKSGSTTETIANFELVLALLQKYHPNDYQDYVVAITDAGSPFCMIAQEQRYTVLELPKLVGGRYSVFSAVGLFPLGMLGISIDQLIAGARAGVQNALSADLYNNTAALSAALHVAAYRDGKNIHDMFIFSSYLQDMGAWYRQLVGESLGKKYDRDGNLVEVGMMPTTSLGSTDLHSVGQLYLAGPRDKFTTFIAVEKNNHTITVPDFPIFDRLVKNIQGRNLADIMDAIMRGTQAAYCLDHRPFVSVVIPEKSAYYCAQFMQLCMIEVMYSGYLLSVDPFDQPNVESYKQETRKILAHE